MTDTKRIKVDVMVQTGDAERRLRKVTESVKTFENGMLKTSRTVYDHGKVVSTVTKSYDKQGDVVNRLVSDQKKLRQGFLGTGDSLKSILAKVASWTIATGVIFGTIGALREMLRTMTDVDDKMVMLNKVFQGTQSQLGVLKSDIMDISVGMGNLIGPSIEAATEWARMGRQGSELAMGLEASLLAQNIAEIDAADAAKLLNAAMIQFNKSMDESIGILDEWNELSNRMPVTVRDLADSVSKAGAVFKVAGSTIEDLNAYTTALTASLARSGREVGNALKTIGSYVQGGERMAKIVRITGIEIEGQNESLMDVDDILVQLASKWSTLTDVQKQEVSQAAAGVRQKAVFLSLMENFNLVLDAYKVQWESAGSAMRENEVRMGSLRTKMEQLSASIQKFAVQSGDKGILKALKGIVDYSRQSVEAFNDLNGATQLVMTGFAVSLPILTNYVLRLEAVKNAALMTKVALGGVVLLGGTLALGALTKYLSREAEQAREASRALKDHNRQLQVMAQNQKSIIQQRDVFESLVKSLNRQRAAGEDTTVTVERLKRVWDAINDVNPEILRGIDGWSAGLDRLNRAADDATGKLKKYYDQMIKNERKSLEIEKMRILPGISSEIRGDEDKLWDFLMASERFGVTDKGFFESLSDPRKSKELFRDMGDEMKSQVQDLIISTSSALSKLDTTTEAGASIAKGLYSGFRDEFGRIAGGQGAFGTALIDKGDIDAALNYYERKNELGAEELDIQKTLLDIAVRMKKLGPRTEAPSDDGDDGARKLKFENQILEDRFKQELSMAQARGASEKEILAIYEQEIDRRAKMLFLEDTSVENVEKLAMEEEAYRDILLLIYDKEIALERIRGKSTKELEKQAKAAEKLAEETAKQFEDLSRKQMGGFGLANELGLGEFARSDIGLEKSIENLKEYRQGIVDSGEATEYNVEQLKNIDAVLKIIAGDYDDIVRKQERLTEEWRRSGERLGYQFGQDIGTGIGRAFSGDSLTGILEPSFRMAGDMLGAAVAEQVSKKMAVSMGDDMMGTFLGAALGGGMGGIIAGLIGFAADKIFGERTPQEELTDAVNQNTLALNDNTKAFQDFQERLINAPSGFLLPPAAGDVGGAGGGSNSLTSYNGGGASSYVSPNSLRSMYNQSSLSIGEIVVKDSGSPQATAVAVRAEIQKYYANQQSRGAHLSQTYE